MKLVNVQVIKDELERLIRNYWFLSSAEAKYRCVVYMELSEWLDGLDAKEVDLDFQTFAKEMDSVFALPSSETKNTEEEPLNWEYSIAKHFFELGLKAKGE